MFNITSHYSITSAVFMSARTDPLRFIGRIGKLKDAVSFCSYVFVEAYDSEAAEYEVKWFREREGSSLRIKHSDITFQTTPEFVDMFPSHKFYFIQRILDMRNIQSGNVVDFRQCSVDPVVEGGKLFIRGSYRFVG